MAAYNFQCGHAFIHPHSPISNHNLLPKAVCKTICLTHPTRCSQQIILEARCEACIIDEYRASIKLIQAFMQPGDFNAIQSWSIKEEEEDRKLDAIREEEHLFTRAGETWHIDEIGRASCRERVF